jgi:hypothetical protein
VLFLSKDGQANEIIFIKFRIRTRAMALGCLDDVRVVSFTADRTQVRPGDGGAQLSWEVFIPAGCNVTLALNGARVSNTSSMRVNPVQDITYQLIARLNLQFKPIGSVSIAVDNSDCSVTEIPESVVASQVQQSVDESIRDYNNNPDTENKVSKRRETQVEVERDGIVLRLRLKLQINNFFDPDIDIDAKIAIRVSAEGRPVVFYRSFSVDVDWPWWVTGITLGITKIVEEFLDNLVQNQLKPKLLNDFKQNIEDQISGQTIGAIETVQDAVLITIC